MTRNASIADFSPRYQRQIADRLAAENRARVETAAVERIEAKRSKYGNKKVSIDGLLFDSEKEGRRYIELKALLHGRQITNLQIHPKFKLEVNGVKIATYIADFVYDDKDGKQITEDVKGVLTRDYKMKKRLMLAIFGIEVREV